MMKGALRSPNAVSCAAIRAARHRDKQAQSGFPMKEWWQPPRHAINRSVIEIGEVTRFGVITPTMREIGIRHGL